jgi:alanine racemase
MKARTEQPAPVRRDPVRRDPAWRGAGETTAALVHLDRLEANLRAVRRHLRAGTRVFAVVKADAYGHGAARVAGTLDAAGVDGFAVSSTAEGVELRRAGIRSPVLVLGPIQPSEAEAVVATGLTASVSSPELALALSAVSLAAGRRSPVHVRVDLGLGGMGVPTEAAAGFVAWAGGVDGLAVEGIYGHPSGPYCADPVRLAAEQAAFAGVLDELARAGRRPPVAHAFSSPGLALARAARHDAVRLGSVLYGIPMTQAPVPGVRPVLEIRSLVAGVRTVPAGTSLAYETGFEATREMRLLTVPVGFSHAPFLGRVQGLEILVRGRRVPVVGRAFMTMLLADGTSLPAVEPGDEVVLLGRDGDEEIAIGELAARAGLRPSAIPFLGPGVGRRYLERKTAAAKREPSLAL